MVSLDTYSLMKYTLMKGAFMATLVSARRKSVFFIILIISALISGCSGPVIDNGSESEIPRELAAVQTLIDSGSTRKACKKVIKWVKANPASEYMELGLKLEGDAFFARKEYYKSYLAYEKILNEYGATTYFSYAIEREIAIAQKFLAGQKRRFWKIFWVTARLEGLTILDDIDSRWPGSAAGARAIMTRADYFYDYEKYFEAEQEYHRLIVAYAKSCYYPRAMYREAESKLKQFEGVYYDSICLDEAQVLYQQYKLRFPADAARLNVDAKLEFISSEKVKKEYEIADFYYRTGKTRQAVIYWNSVIEMAPESDYAQKAIANIQKVQAGENS